MTNTTAGGLDYPRSALTLGAGAVAGVVACVVYTVYVEAINVLANGVGAFFVPFRQIAAVALGPSALDPGYDLTTAVAVGSVVHFAVAIVFGVLVALVLRALNVSSRGMRILIGTVAGLALYALNLFAVFPAAFPWFLANDPVVQTIGHGLFGGVTGAWFRRREYPSRS